MIKLKQIQNILNKVVTTGKAFFNQLKEAFTILEDITEQISKDMVIDLFLDIAYGTPVKTGNALSNWNIGTSNNGEYTEVDFGGTVEQNRDSASQVVERKADEFESNSSDIDIVIYNNTPYIEELEGGSSIEQAPNGFIQPALSRFGMKPKRIEGATIYL